MGRMGRWLPVPWRVNGPKSTLLRAFLSIDHSGHASWLLVARPVTSRGGPLGGHSVLVSAVSAGTREDVASWLEIAREVEPLFGPMPDFESTLRRNIRRGTALCVRDPSGQVLGGMLLRAAPHTQITWLAVRSSARRQGVGHALVAEALRRYPPSCEVLVDTFGQDSIEGYPARRLYESFSFLPGEDLPNGADGGSRQRFRLRRR
jgi:ribosomal protein S18 acetylase RimI-like enzyme